MRQATTVLVQVPAELRQRDRSCKARPAHVGHALMPAAKWARPSGCGWSPRAPARARDAVMETWGGGVEPLLSLAPRTDRDLGSHTGASPSADLRVFFLQLSIVGSTMGTVGELAELTTLMATTGVRPIIDRIVPMTDAREAFAAMHAGDVHGKLVLTR
jgi:hypothetical protein